MAASRASSDLAAIIGRNIRSARKDAGLNQRQLAERVGVVDGMAVSRWERGEHRPSAASLIQLAEALGCEIGWFYTDHGRAAA